MGRLLQVLFFRGAAGLRAFPFGAATDLHRLPLEGVFGGLQLGDVFDVTGPGVAGLLSGAVVHVLRRVLRWWGISWSSAVPAILQRAESH